MMFYFPPADIVSQILNFGLPAPIDIQIMGRDIEANHHFANDLMAQLSSINGIADLRIQQPFNQPKLHINVDRTKTIQAGFTQRDVASNLLVSLSGSFQTSPSFWLDPKSGVSYSVRRMAPQYEIQSLQDLQNIPVSGASTSNGGVRAPWQQLANLGTITRGVGMATVSHYDAQNVIDIFGSTQGRDLGGVAKEIESIVNRNRSQLPRGSQIFIRGQIDTMHSSFRGLLAGLGFAILLIYLLIVVNFQSWLDPFIIISALPAALGWNCLDAFRDAHHDQRAGVDRLHHVHGRGHGKQHSGGQFFQRASTRRARSDSCRGGSRFYALSSCNHDGDGHDHRHVADGGWTWRRRRAECSVGTRGHRRLDFCDGRDASLRTCCIQLDSRISQQPGRLR